MNEPPPRAITEFLAAPYALANEQVEHYRKRGFVKLEQVISGEPLRYFREMIGYAVGHYFVEDDRAPADKRVYERSFLQAVNLASIYPAIRPFAHAFRFADLARRLMGIRGVRLWFDQALYKQPEALRLPAMHPLRLIVSSAGSAGACLFVLAVALPTPCKPGAEPGVLVRRLSPYPAVPPAGSARTSQASWRPFP